MAPPPLSLKARALRLLGAREHSRAELERKLRSQEQATGELAQVLDQLQTKGFISAQRVVESVLHRRADRMGAARIRHELQQKGLDATLIQQAVAGLQASELERARMVWRKKYGAGAPLDSLPPARAVAERARQMRFLASRGFTADTIRRVVSGASDDDDTGAG